MFEILFLVSLNLLKVLSKTPLPACPESVCDLYSNIKFSGLLDYKFMDSGCNDFNGCPSQDPCLASCKNPERELKCTHSIVILDDFAKGIQETTGSWSCSQPFTANTTVSTGQVCGGSSDKTCEGEQKCHVETEGNNGTCVSDIPNPGETCGHLTCGKDLQCETIYPPPCFDCNMTTIYRCIKKKAPTTCENVTCPSRSTCFKGTCIAIDDSTVATGQVCGGSSDKTCEGEQKCHVETEGNNGTCVSDIPNPGETCGHLTCGKDLQCETIYPPPCFDCNMTTIYRCIKKKAPRTCENVTCPSRSTCFKGTCIAIDDSTVATGQVCGGSSDKTCEGEQKCHVETEGNNGTCVSDIPNPGETCGHLTCGKDLQCETIYPPPCFDCNMTTIYRCIKKKAPTTCENVTCPSRSTCFKGTCIAIDDSTVATGQVCGGSSDKTCEGEQKCHVETEGNNGTCVSDIPNPGETCGHLTCGKDLQCETIYPPPCFDCNMTTIYRCIKKKAPTTCENVTCPSRSTCFKGTCIAIDDSTVATGQVCGGSSDKTCEGEQKCHVETEGNNGTCVSDIPNPGETCGHLTCGKDLQCETIYPPPCFDCNMTTIYRCIKKKAPTTCENVICPSRSTCFKGTCIAIGDSTVANDQVCGGSSHKTCEGEQKCHVETEGNKGTCVSDIPNPGETCGHLTCGKDLKCSIRFPMCANCKPRYRCTRKD